MVVGIEISKIEIPKFVQNLPDNIVQQLIGKQGGYRLQRSVAEHMKLKWKAWVPAIFHKRRDGHLPVSNKFRDAFKYSVTKDVVILSVAPCYGKDGFNYVKSLMYGRKEILGFHYVPFEDVDCLMKGGKVEATKPYAFDNLMSTLEMVFNANIGKWSETMLARAIKAAGGK